MEILEKGMIERALEPTRAISRKPARSWAFTATLCCARWSEHDIDGRRPRRKPVDAGAWETGRKSRGARRARRNVSLLIFDLDGTLIDSRLDLAHAVNATRAQMGRGPLPHEEIFSYVGNGAPVLIQRAMGPEATRRRSPRRA